MDSEKHFPKELLLDIKLTQRRNVYGESAIIIAGLHGRTWSPPFTLEADILKNMSPFTGVCSYRA